MAPLWGRGHNKTNSRLKTHVVKVLLLPICTRNGALVAVWQRARLAIAKSRVDSPADTVYQTPTQRAIPLWSVNEYQQKLVSKRAYHALQ